MDYFCKFEDYFCKFEDYICKKRRDKRPETREEVIKLPASGFQQPAKLWIVESRGRLYNLERKKVLFEKE